MASSVIHLAIAKKLKKCLNVKNSYDYYLGAIAPDLSKQISRTKKLSHFLFDTREDVPNMDKFTEKYKYFYKNDFELGYYIHLYTDKIWFNEFINSLTYRNSVKLLDGTIIKATEQEITSMIYQDYTNINIQLIDEYNLDLSLFYEEFSKPHSCLDEIPLNKLNILIDKMGIIIENSKQEKNYIFDLTGINEFIEKSIQVILTELKNYIPN